MEITLATRLDPYEFRSIGGGYALNRGPDLLDVGATLQVGEQIPLDCMFEAFWLTRNGKKVGYFFRSSFQVANEGGYICAFMASQRGTADRVEVLLKTEDLIVFHYPSKGTILVSPHVAAELSVIFQEQ